MLEPSEHGAPGQSGGQASSVAEVVVTIEGDSFSYFESGSGRTLSPQEFVAGVNSRAGTRNVAPWVAVVGIAVAAMLAGSPVVAVVAFAAAIITALILNGNCQRRRQTLVNYRLDEAQQSTYKALQDGLAALSRANAVWRVEPDSVSFVSSRVLAHAGSPQIPSIKASVPIPGIAAGSETFHFFPDQLVIRTRRSYAPISYADLKIETKMVDVAETGWVPADSTTVGRTWRHARRDGGPDRRYRDNPAIPIVRYALVILLAGQYRVGLLVSGIQEVETFASAIQTVGRRFAARLVAARTAVPPAPAVTVPAKQSTEPEPLRRVMLPDAATAAAAPNEVAPASAVTAPAELPKRSEPPVPSVAAGKPYSDPLTETEPPRWVPPGQTVEVAGFRIPGFIYFGRGLRALSGLGVEPALIDPSLSVASSSVGFDREWFQYWASYTEIGASARNFYLSWHAAGRSSPEMPISLVFMYFFGIERRILQDLGTGGGHGEEYSLILAEVRRLLGIYGANQSFRGYASTFLDLAEVIRKYPDLDGPPPDEILPTYGVSARLKLGLRLMARDGKPIPPAWARACVVADPPFPPRTPFTRCREYFNELFEARYRERFGDGVIVTPDKMRVQDDYQQEGYSFRRALTARAELLDVTVLQEPIGKLRALAEECTGELNAYSRYLGRNPGGGKCLAAMALLPPILLSKSMTGHIPQLRDRLAAAAGTGALLTRDRLLKLVEFPDASAFAKREAVALAQLLASTGYGIEPDVRFGGAVPPRDTRVYVFPLCSGAASAPTQAYSAAALLVHLAALVSAADGSISPQEEAHLKNHVAAAMQLAEDERLRLDAHLHWVLAERPGLPEVKKRIDALTLSQREAIGQFLIGVANADGYISPEEVEALGKVYRLLGLNPQDVYSHTHAAATEPVTVKPAEKAVSGFAVPQRQEQKKTAGVQLDPAAVEAKLKETAAVSALLASVFAEEPAPSPVSRAEASGCIPGLDEDASAFVRHLATRGVWSRGELELVASARALLLDGTVEAINEAAFEACDAAALEGDDPVEVNVVAMTALIERTVTA